MFNLTGEDSFGVPELSEACGEMWFLSLSIAALIFHSRSQLLDKKQLSLTSVSLNLHIQLIVGFKKIVFETKFCYVDLAWNSWQFSCLLLQNAEPTLFFKIYIWIC